MTMTINLEKILFVISFGDRKFIWGMARGAAIEIRRKKNQKNRN